MKLVDNVVVSDMANPYRPPGNGDPGAEDRGLGRSGDPSERPLGDPDAVRPGAVRGDDDREMLREWAALCLDERTTATSRSRSVTSSLLQQASQDADWAGLLEQMVLRFAVASVILRDGQSHTGVLAALGSDFLLLDRRPKLLVSLAAIAALRPGPEERGPVPTTKGGLPPSRRPSMAAMLAEIASDRPVVSVSLGREGAVVAGRLIGVGSDVATIQPEGGTTPPTYVWLTSVSVVSLLLSG